MEQFFVKISIPNLEEIQQELINTIKHDFLSRTDTHSWIGDQAEILATCPAFNSFLKTRCISPVRQIKFYCTPANNFLSHHIDGSLSNFAIPFGLNIPLMNTKDTFQYWYDCPEENLMRRNSDMKSLYPNNYWATVDVPKNTNMPVIGKLELTTPSFTKTDIMHNVVNPTDKTRLIVVLRWNIWKPDYKEPCDVFNLEGLEVD